MLDFSGPASCSARLFSFGVISDIQYANIENGFSFKKVPRYYRCELLHKIMPYRPVDMLMRLRCWGLANSLELLICSLVSHRAALPALQRAVQMWKERDVDFGIHFGEPLEPTLTMLSSAPLVQFSMKWAHLQHHLFSPSRSTSLSRNGHEQEWHALQAT